MDEARSRQRISEGRVGRLATVRSDGRPHVVPCCFAVDGDTIYSAIDDIKPKASTQRLTRLDNIGARPQASLLVDHYEDDDWSRLWWARADGNATILERHGRALELLAAKYRQYRDRPPPGPVIAIAVERWSGWGTS